MSDVNKQLLEALKELVIDMKIAQGNMRAASVHDQKWEGCAEAIQPRVDMAESAIAAAEQALPVAEKSFGAWDGLESIDSLPDGTALYAHPPAVAAPDASGGDLAKAMRNIVHLGEEHFKYGGAMVLRTANSCIIDMQDIANEALLDAATDAAMK